MRFRHRHLISLKDYSSEDIEVILSLAKELKYQLQCGQTTELLPRKILAMIFQIPSTRTSVSFESAMTQLGGHGEYLSWDRIWGGKAKNESWRDTIGAISRFVDGLAARVMDQRDLEEAANVAGIPVINASTDMEHPCQALADFLTLSEKKGRFEGLNYCMTWAWKKSNPPAGLINSSLYLASRLGVNLRIACPKGYEPDPDILSIARRQAAVSGGHVDIVYDMKEAVANADAVNIYCWAPPEVFRAGLETGFKAPAPHNERPGDYKHWIVTEDVLKLARPNAIAMHCMPAARGDEVTDEVLDGPQSVILDEAENRLHVQKAILALLLGGSR